MRVNETNWCCDASKQTIAVDGQLDRIIAVIVNKIWTSADHGFNADSTIMNYVSHMLSLKVTAQI